MKKLKCPNKRCTHIWDYNGKKTYGKTSCPDCGWKVNLDTNLVKITLGGGPNLK